MENLTELIRSRRSVRTYDGRDLSEEDLKKLRIFMAEVKNPYEIPLEFKLLDGKNQPLKCPVVSGTDLFVGAKINRTAHMEEAFGYSFEMLVLYAQSLGIGTVWVGGTMDRKAFEQAMELTGEERMPCMSPLGYPAKKMSVKETVMRKAVRADSRNPFESLFFSSDFDTPLTPENAGKWAYPLEMVRLAPSAVNKQPWRVVVRDNAAHFYLNGSKGFVSDAVGNMQKVDMGIALCHFELAAREKGLNPQFLISDPQIPTDLEYIASFKLA